MQATHMTTHLARLHNLPSLLKQLTSPDCVIACSNHLHDFPHNSLDPLMWLAQSCYVRSMLTTNLPEKAAPSFI